jgi:hypothetical protein
VWRVPIPNRYTAKAKLCFCKNNKRTIIIDAIHDRGRTDNCRILAAGRRAWNAVLEVDHRERLVSIAIYPVASDVRDVLSAAVETRLQSHVRLVGAESTTLAAFGVAVDPWLVSYAAHALETLTLFSSCVLLDSNAGWISWVPLPPSRATACTKASREAVASAHQWQLVELLAGWYRPTPQTPHGSSPVFALKSPGRHAAHSTVPACVHPGTHLQSVSDCRPGSTVVLCAGHVWHSAAASES